MKHIKLILLLLVSVSFLTCERDDLCPETTPTTPSMIIGLFNLIAPESPKNVFDLVVAGIGNDTTLPGFSLVDTDEIILPLKTDADITQFALISDTEVDTDGNIIGGNQDIITISYLREDIFVSRACGFKTIFRNVVVTIEPDADNWIQLALPLNDNLTIEDETTTHYFFYH